jgi:uncharacterized membrane protein
MFLTAIRRFARFVLFIAGFTVAVSLLIGTLLGASPQRALTLGFYAVGCFLMVAGFFVGNRGPARVKSESLASPVSPFAMFGARQLRWATLREQEETIHNSAFFISLGLVLVVVGLLVDSRHSLF